MYAALNLENQLVYASQAISGDAYLCPRCQKSVQLIESVAGNRPYFRHLQKIPFRQTESELHRRGKQQLQTILQREKGVVESEVTLGIDERRADVLWLTERQTIALEFQCANISTTELAERHVSYQRLQIKDIWLLGETYLTTDQYRPKKNALKFICYGEEWGYYLAFWLPDRAVVRLFRQLAFQPPKTEVTFQVDDLQLAQFLQISYRGTSNLTVFPKVCLSFDPSYFLAQQLNLQQSNWLSLQTSCYERGFSLQSLPQELWLPSRLPPLYLSWTTPLRRQVSWYCQQGELDWVDRSRILLTSCWPLLSGRND